MKYSDHPMPLTEGEYPWERETYCENGVWKERWVQCEDGDIEEPKPEVHHGYYIEGDNTEYYDKVTVCTYCGTMFIAYKSKDGYETEPVRNYCPGCGKVLAGKMIEEG